MTSDLDLTGAVDVAARAGYALWRERQPELPEWEKLAPLVKHRLREDATPIVNGLADAGMLTNPPAGTP